MAKINYTCSQCAYQTGKWYGRCPECGTWNSFEETLLEDKKKNVRGKISDISTPQKINEITSLSEERISTTIEEFDRVLGGNEAFQGIVPGSVMLLSGDPGVGKSTLLLQLALNLSKTPDVKSKKGSLPSRTVLYVTGEESETQVKMRAERIVGALQAHANLSILATTNVDHAISVIEKEKPTLVVIDSIQTMASEDTTSFPGSLPQIRYSTGALVTVAKRHHIPMFLVGHVTKEGIVAGPQLLSHMVDTVLYLEGEPLTGTRILRSFKNRFGDTSEVGIFIMGERGLVQLTDAGAFFTKKRDEQVAGSCIAVVMEGTRPILVEIQALCVPSTLSFPRRVASGIDSKRLELLLAVIHKHLRIPIDKLDIFVNVVGGLKVSEPAADLAVIFALLSSYKNKPLGALAAIAEVGLLGELKTVVQIEKRIKEAKKFGFKKVIAANSAQFLYNATKGLV